MILNRWVFERASNEKQRFLVMPMAVVVNVFLAVPGGLVGVMAGEAVGVMAGEAVGLMFSNRKPDSRELIARTVFRNSRFSPP